VRKINPDIHVLGKKCLYNHTFNDTNLSLRYKKGNACVICQGKHVKSWSERNPKTRKSIYAKWLKLNPKRRKDIDENFRVERKNSVKMVRRLVDHQIVQELHENLMGG